MGIFDVFSAKENNESQAVSELFTYLKSLVNREDLVSDFWNKYKSGDYVSAYLGFEKFIASNKPIIVKKEITREELIQEIRSKIETEKFPDDLKVFFLPHPDNILGFFWVSIKPLTDLIVSSFGPSKINEIVKQTLGSEDFKFDPKTKDEDIYKSLYEVLRVIYGTVETSFGKEAANKAIENTYKNLVNKYPEEWLKIFFEFLPDGLLASQKLSYFSKEDLVKKVDEATKVEREKLALSQSLYQKLKEQTNQVEIQNKDLEETKRAMFNILEDERMLEEDLRKEKAGVETKVVERTKELTEEKAKLLAAINAIRRGFVLVNTTGQVILHNDSLNSIFSTNIAKWSLGDIQEMFGKTFDFLANYNKCMAELKVLDFTEITLGPKYIKVYMAPVLGEEKVLIGVVVTISDVTEAKILERSKDEFFSIASHELRTPLTAIRGNTSLMKEMYADNFKDPDLAEMVNDIHDASVRLIGIVNDFLNMSRLEMGKMEFKIEPTNLVDVSKEVIKEVEPSAMGKKVAVVVTDPVGNLPNVKADKNRLKEVLINLIGNSLKFTDTGSITISFEVMPNFIKTMVTDTGRGIPVVNQSLLFRKFQQAGTSLFTRDNAKGTGLGLYISKLMVEGMGGKIQLEKSVEGQGSVFSFTLPIDVLK